MTIGRLSERGEGVAEGPDGLVFVPYALPGDTVLAEVENGRGKLVEILQPSPSRIPPHCPYFTRCGGCAVQTLEADAYANWKRDLVATALRRAGVSVEVGCLADAHGQGRRRATFHARFKSGRP
ncbi:MAG TPA: RNA methyltransferase, partial [Methylocella sp.]|nr:RNA methyltransferase [Methylocella sp.]